MITIRLNILLSISLCLILPSLYFEPIDGSTNITADELRCQVSKTHDYLHTAIEMIKVAQNKLPKDFDLVDGDNTNDTKIVQCPKTPVDCEEVLQQGNRVSGVYQIWPRSRILKGPIDVYCDMETDGGGWTVIQRRGDYDRPNNYFYQDWNSYKTGFGDIQKDFWLGNDKLFSLTNQREYEIRFHLVDWEGNSTYAMYDEFWIEDESQAYTLHVQGYRGTAGDSFTGHNGAKFTTKDRDNDTYSKNCAVEFKGAWWYTACHASNLNGFYLRGKHDSYADGVEWTTLKGDRYSFKETVMEIRPAGFNKELLMKKTIE